MIDITKFKPYFPLKSIDDVEKLFKCNIDPEMGSPNLTLLSIVVGLIEHSLTTINDKHDLEKNSSNIDFSKEKNRVRTSSNKSLENFRQHLASIASSTNEVNKECQTRYQDKPSLSPDNNEAGHVLSDSDDNQSGNISPINSYTNLTIPEVEFEVVETLYRRFVDQIRTSIDLKDPSLHRTNLKIKKISDILWFNLSNSYYKDKAHLQSIFSYLTTSKLDCFGLAFAVISGCQILNLKNVYLALSEDHAWVMIDIPEEEKEPQKLKEINEYIENSQLVPACASHETCEVTWHGKANSDKRGQPVTYKNCWLYTNGYAVKCDVKLCVAALVSSINPSINTNTDSEVLALLQQRLLWLLFKAGNCFPMSLGNLGELEDICPTDDALLSPLKLFHMGIEMSRQNYNDSHVYPYTYLASFFFRHGRFKEALETWADASAVMTKYNYSKDDSEIYNEFLEIAKDLIPSMLKVLTAGGLEPSQMSEKPLLQDPECLALILKVYDNICLWEEGSSTPVLHIGWAKCFVATILKFSSTVRSKIKLWTDEEWKENKPSYDEQFCEVTSREQCSSTDNHNSVINSSNNDSNDGKNKSNFVNNDAVPKNKDSSELPRGIKRHLYPDNQVETSEDSRHKVKREKTCSIEATPDSNHDEAKVDSVKEKRYYIDESGNVHLVLWSQKLTGARALLQAQRLNVSAIELQLTAQSQCVVRSRSNSGSNSNSISSSLNLGSSTRSKRLNR